MSDVKIAPSILSADFSRLGVALTELEQAGADWMHLDVMDGHFVPNLTFGPPVIKALRPCSQLPFDAHLMVERPEDLIHDYLLAGVNHVTVHVEAVTHLHRTIHWLRSTGLKAGVSLNPATSLSLIEEIVGDVDIVLVMSVNPGFGGQEFIPSALDKIRRCRAMLDRVESRAELAVDGGVTARNVGDIVRAGATTVIAGSALFGHPEGPAGGLRELRAAIRAATRHTA